MEEYIIKFLNQTQIKIDTVAIVKLVIILIITAALIIALTVIHKRIFTKLKSNNDLRKAQIYRISFRIARLVVIAIGTVAMLQAIGINLTGFSAGIGVLFVFVLLAAKDALQDVFNSAVIMADKYFNVGDAVEYEGKEGIIVSFTARTTKIELLEDRSVLSVANRNISAIRKMNHLVDIDLPLSYDLSGKQAFSVLNTICDKIRRLEGVESCELKGTQDFGASAIVYKIRFYCEPHDRPDIRRAVIKTVQDGLEAEDIQIPYQQIDVHER